MPAKKKKQSPAYAEIRFEGEDSWVRVELTTLAVAEENNKLLLQSEGTELLVVGPELPESTRDLIDDIESLKASTSILKPTDEAGVLVPETEYVSWGETLLNVRRFKLEIDEGRLEITRPIDRIKKAIMDRVKPYTEALAKIEENITKFLEDWREEKRRSDAERATQQQLELTRRQQDRAVRVAQTLEARGQHQAAEEVIERAVVATPPPVPQSAPPEIRGLNFKPMFEWEVENPDLLPREYLMADTDKIAARVKTFGEQHGIPGVIAWTVEELKSVNTKR